MPVATKIKSGDKERSGSAEGLEHIQVGYGCSCGEKFPVKVDFTNHLLFAGQRDGKGTHKSLGRIDMLSGEVIHGPWASRSKEERKQTKTKPPTGGAGSSSGDATRTAQSSGTPAAAQQIRLVPRVFTIDYTPIMRAGQDAATKFFGWRADMPLENFLDTVLYLYFKEKGVTLCGYIVDDRLLKKEGNDGH